MKLRIAKKITTSPSKSRKRRLDALYPPFEKDGRIIYPSWHKFPLITKANQRIKHYCRKGYKV